MMCTMYYMMETVYGLDASFDSMKDRKGIWGKAGDVNDTKTDEIFRWILNDFYTGKYITIYFLNNRKTADERQQSVPLSYIT